MSFAIKAVLPIAVAIAAVVAMATLSGALPDLLAGLVALVAILVFARAIMDFAAEPGEESQR
jgi:L-lactate permease